MRYKFLLSAVLICFVSNAQAQFVFSPSVLDFGTLQTGQARYLVDTVANNSGNFVWIGSLRDLGPSKRIRILSPPQQPIGLAQGRQYVFTIEYYADSASTEVDTIVVSQYQNGQGERLMVHGSAHDTVAREVAQAPSRSPTLRIEHQPVEGNLRIELELPKAGEVSFTIRDLLGRIMMTKRIVMMSGTHEYLFPTASLAAGDYILEMSASSYRLVQKFVMIR